jgi:hypothetical protein
MQIEKSQTTINCRHKKLVYFRKRHANVVWEFWQCLQCRKIIRKSIWDVRNFFG